MDKGSVCHWLVALVVFCVPILLLVRYRQLRTAAVAKAPPKGIGGWLALFAFLLCLGFMRSVMELVQGMPEYCATSSGCGKSITEIPQPVHLGATLGNQMNVKSKDRAI